jgi:hypothetical protein
MKICLRVTTEFKLIKYVQFMHCNFSDNFSLKVVNECNHTATGCFTRYWPQSFSYNF